MGHHRLLLQSSSSHLLLQPPCSHHHQPLLHHHHTLNLLKFDVPICRNGLQRPKASPFPFTTTSRGSLSLGRGRGKRRGTQLRASARESPYEVLGVSPSATPQEIKRAYRRLALKCHPDVNKEAKSEEKFMRIKHAYNTLINKRQRADYSSTTPKRDNSWGAQDDEEFYGLGNFVRDVQITLGDFFRDLEAEFQNWESSLNSNEKPKSLWEELADIGEEFVDFLEKELKVNEMNDDYNNGMPQDRNNSNKSREAGDASKKEAKNESTLEDSIDEIEAALQQLKKELGL